MTKSISILIPAYNEEKNIADTVKVVDKYANMFFSDYEILLFNDGSSDNTGSIADLLLKDYKNLKVTHNKGNQCLGYNFREAIRISRCEYFTWFPGDNDVAEESVKEIFSHAGEADIITTYPMDDTVRTWFRRTVSKLYTRLVNFLFGFRLRYYNGIVIYQTNMLKHIKISTSSFAIFVEILVPLIKKGYSYKEFPFRTKGNKISHMIKARNIKGIISTVVKLFFRINILGSYWIQSV